MEMANRKVIKDVLNEYWGKIKYKTFEGFPSFAGESCHGDISYQTTCNIRHLSYPNKQTIAHEHLSYFDKLSCNWANFDQILKVVSEGLSLTT